MTLRDIVKESWLAIYGNKVRSMLTVLGIVIGVMAVVIMVAAGETVRAEIANKFSSLGSNTMMVRAGAAKQAGVHTGNRATLTMADGDAIRRLADVVAVTPVHATSAQIVYGNQNWYTMLMGVGPEYPGVQTTEMECGDFFTDSAMRNAAMHVVIGPKTASELGMPANPVGEIIRIQNMPFTVVGMPRARGDSGLGNQDDMVMIPATTLRKRIQGSRFPDSVGGIALKIDPSADSGIVAEQISVLLRARHRLKDNEEDDFFIADMKDVMARLNRVTGYMQLLLVAIAAVSLIVGAIGIMNMMLVSVVERTREIGVRKAIGARQSNIVAQFLIESVLIAFCGSMIGMLLGVGLAQGIGRMVLHFHVPFSAWPLLLSVGVAAIVGLIAGVFPAYRAAKLNPIDSLRRE